MNQREPSKYVKGAVRPPQRHFCPLFGGAEGSNTVAWKSCSDSSQETFLQGTAEKEKWLLSPEGGWGGELAPWKLRTGNFSLTHHIIFVFGFSDVKLSISVSILTLCASQDCPLAAVTPFMPDSMHRHITSSWELSLTSTLLVFVRNNWAAWSVLFNLGRTQCHSGGRRKKMGLVWERESQRTA